MDVIYYASGKNDTARKIRRFKKRLSPYAPGIFVDSIQGLVQRLARIGNRPEIAVLVADGQVELKALLAIGNLLSGTRIILILPDNLPETVAKGLDLFPRYFTSMGTDMETVFEILKKMVTSSPIAQQSNATDGVKTAMPNTENHNPVNKASPWIFDDI